MNLRAHLNAKDHFGFIVTKPLQFMIAASIIDQKELSLRTDILVVNSFSDADRFVGRYHSLEPRWGHVELFKNPAEAYRYARNRGYGRLFIDSDFGVSKFLTLLRNKIARPTTRFAVYEEGTGTYRIDRYKDHIKRALLHHLGVGSAFGGSVFTDRIYVYEPQRYRECVGRYGCTAVGIETKLVDFIRTNKADLSKLFDVPRATAGNGEEPCNLYLTDWALNRDIISEIGKKPGVFFVKPHPHRTDVSANGKIGPAFVLPAGVPAEILIMNLRSKHKDLTVYHHGSSAAHYLAASGVRFEAV